LCTSPRHAATTTNPVMAANHRPNGFATSECMTFLSPSRRNVPPSERAGYPSARVGAENGQKRDCCSGCALPKRGPVQARHDLSSATPRTADPLARHFLLTPNMRAAPRGRSSLRANAARPPRYMAPRLKQGLCCSVIPFLHWQQRLVSRVFQDAPVLRRANRLCQPVTRGGAPRSALFIHLVSKRNATRLPVNLGAERDWRARCRALQGV
jgi:hypothetical protein